MSYYKIRLNCTSQKDLTINENKISRISYNNLETKPDNMDYITKIAILYEDNFHSKNETNYINKTIEFYCDRLITEIEFINFINNLKKIGFVSKRKEPKIQLIDNEGKIYYNYNYNLVSPFPNNKIKSIYRQQNLYVKN
jgi:hypothetical protein